MNKAFTREQDEDDGDDALPEFEEVPGGKNFMTPSGAVRLREETDRLEKERTAVLADADGAARADLPAATRRQLKNLEKRIGLLKRRIEITVVVDPAGHQPDHVAFGATVVIRFEDGAEREFSIVGIDEADAAKGRVSWVSPLARAVMNGHPGDIVQFTTPRGIQDIEIIRVSYPAP